MSTTIKEKLQLLLNTKTQFKNDIINAGGTIDNSTPFSSYPAIYKTLKGGAPDGTAVEVSTEADMDALLIADNIGKFYKYIGETTDKYTNGAYYVVQDSENPIVNESTNSGTITGTPTININDKISIPYSRLEKLCAIASMKTSMISATYLIDILKLLTYYGNTIIPIFITNNISGMNQPIMCCFLTKVDKIGFYYVNMTTYENFPLVTWDLDGTNQVNNMTLIELELICNGFEGLENLSSSYTIDGVSHTTITELDGTKIYDVIKDIFHYNEIVVE